MSKRIDETMAFVLLLPLAVSIIIFIHIAKLLYDYFFKNTSSVSESDAKDSNTYPGRCGPEFNDQKCSQPNECCSVDRTCGGQRNQDSHFCKNTGGLGIFKGKYDAPMLYPGRCGTGFNEQKCGYGEYCSRWNSCGTSDTHKFNARSEYNGPNSDIEYLNVYRCGENFNNTKCPEQGQCCSEDGFCGGLQGEKSVFCFNQYTGINNGAYDGPARDG